MAHFDTLTYTMGREPRTLSLAPVTLFVGPQRSGKTTALKAIELALLGKGDTPTAELNDLVHKGRELSTELTGPGLAGHLVIPVKTNKAQVKESVETRNGFDPAQVLPVVSVGSLVDGGSTLRAAVLRRFGSGELKIANKAVDRLLRELWPKASDTAVMSVEGSGDVLKHIQAEINALGREVGVLERQIEASAPPTGAETEIRRLQNKIDKYEKALTEFPEGQEWQAYAPHVVQTEATELERLISEIQPELDKVENNLAGANAILGVFRKAKKDEIDCFLCGGGKVDVPGRKTKWEAAVKKLVLKRQKLEGKRSTLATQLRDLIDPHKPKVDDWRTQLNDLVGAMERVHMKEEAQTEIHAKRDMQDQLQLAKKQLKRAVEGQAASALADAVQAVNDVLPANADDPTVFGLRESGQSLKWTVLGEDGVERVLGMSGAERGQLALRVPLAFAGDEPPVVLFDDDDLKGFSVEGVRELMRNLIVEVETDRIRQVVLARHKDRAEVEFGDGFEYDLHSEEFTR